MDNFIPTASEERSKKTLQFSSQINISEEEEDLNSFAKFMENQQRLGWLGKLFGANKEKSGNITSLSIVFSFLLILLIIFCPIEDKTYQKKDFLEFQQI